MKSIAVSILAVALVASIFAKPASAANRPPSAPWAPLPGDGSTFQSITPTLTWWCDDPDGDELVYDIYFGTEWPPPQIAVNVPQRSYVPGTLVHESNYYWRVVARDPVGEETSGAIWSFTTRPVNMPPYEPWLYRPWYGAVDWPVITGLIWTSSGDADGHRVTFDVYFGTEPTPPLVATDVEYGYYDVSPLAFTTRYYWTVVARDELGAETSTDTYFFTTKANSPPNAPLNPVPGNGGIASVSPMLSWDADDQDGQSLTYSVYFGTSLTPPLVATSLTSPTYDLSNLQPLTRYYWRVEASDGQYTSSSPMWSFTALRPGDVVADGTLTSADVDCAMQVYLWNTACGGTAAYTVADVNCDGTVTPRDARCLNKQIVDGSCEICEEAIGNAPTLVSTPTPAVSVSSIHTSSDTLAISLAVSDVAAIESFGFYISYDPRMRLLGVRSNVSGFETIATRGPYAGTTVVGGYSLTSATVSQTGEFVELLFDVSHGIAGALFLDGFVDDLNGADPLFIPHQSVVGVEAIGSKLMLHQNRPNPFNPRTTVTYEIPPGIGRPYVRMRIVDARGIVMRTLVDGTQAPGLHEVDWDGMNTRGARVASGVYFCVLDVGGERRTRRLTLLK